MGHFLHRLRRRAVDLTAYPVIFGVGVNPQFDDFVGGAGFRWIRGCHGFLKSRILVPLNNLMSSSRQILGCHLRQTQIRYLSPLSRNSRQLITECGLISEFV